MTAVLRANLSHCECQTLYKHTGNIHTHINTLKDTRAQFVSVNPHRHACNAINMLYKKLKKEEYVYAELELAGACENLTLHLKQQLLKGKVLLQSVKTGREEWIWDEKGKSRKGPKVMQKEREIGSRIMFNGTGKKTWEHKCFPYCLCLNPLPSTHFSTRKGTYL